MDAGAGAGGGIFPLPMLALVRMTMLMPAAFFHCDAGADAGDNAGGDVFPIPMLIPAPAVVVAIFPFRYRSVPAEVTGGGGLWPGRRR